MPQLRACKKEIFLRTTQQRLFQSPISRTFQEMGIYFFLAKKPVYEKFKIVPDLRKFHLLVEGETAKIINHDNNTEH